MEKEERGGDAHVLLVPFPRQGHINPLLQFANRLLSKGIRVTMAVTKCLVKSMDIKTGPVRIETFSDGYDDRQEDTTKEYFERFKIVGSQTLTELIQKQERLGDPVNCIVYDAFLPWFLDVAKQFNLIAAPFFTQSCAICNIYYHVQQGLLKVPVAGPLISISGLPLLAVTDLPSILSTHESRLPLVLNLFSNIDKADWLLFNSFDKLEQEVINWMTKLWPVKTVGPSVPSMYLDKQVQGNKEYGLNVFMPVTDACMNWLNVRKTSSVVYVSFGSISELGDEQMIELASCLKESKNHFLWVVRQSEQKKLPSNFVEETLEKGLVVSWCSQLEVLSHKAVGCFVTHCGWNSTIESLSLGVPMVGLPQWTDQPTNAKYIKDVWGTGLRAKVDENGTVVKEEILACIREVMQGEKGKEIKRNAIKWKELTKEAVDVGGSSDKNIEEFVASLSCPLKD